MVFLLFLVTSFFLHHCESAFEPDTTIFWDMTAKLDVSLEGLEFQFSTKHNTECARACGENESCLAFTFTEGRCQGYSKVSVTQNPRELVFGEKYFVRRHSVKQIQCQASAVETLVEPTLSLVKEVFCEEDWIVILRRQDGSVDFYRDWEQYVRGFGNIHGEFWFGTGRKQKQKKIKEGISLIKYHDNVEGLEALHKLTSSQNYDLVVELKDWDDVYKNAIYTQFYVTSAADNYRLHVEFVGGKQTTVCPLMVVMPSPPSTTTTTPRRRRTARRGCTGRGGSTTARPQTYAACTRTAAVMVARTESCGAHSTLTPTPSSLPR